jgi:hypothetical protein
VSEDITKGKEKGKGKPSHLGRYHEPLTFFRLMGRVCRTY